MRVLGCRQDQRLPLEGGQLWPCQRCGSQHHSWDTGGPGPHDMGRMTRAMGGTKWTHMYLCAHACIHIWPFQNATLHPPRVANILNSFQLPLGLHVTGNSGSLSFGIEGSQVLTAPRNQVLSVLRPPRGHRETRIPAPWPTLRWALLLGEHPERYLV